MRKRQKRPYFWIRKRGGMAAVCAKWGCALAIVLVLGTTTVALALSSLPPALRLGEALVVVFLWWFAMRSLLDDPLPGLAPYFDRPIGDIHTYSRGHLIALRCPELDDVAITAGAKAISFFGFSDDFRGEPLSWHDTTEGLKTFLTLKQELAHSEPQGSTLLEELGLVIDALQKAQAKSARFCLLITYGYTNAMEHEQRKGSFF
jgi:hypothetical protein